MTMLSGWKQMLQRLGTHEQPRAERSNAVGLAARYGLDASITPAAIKDISASGIYLVTEKRLASNELISLCLHEESRPENSSELQFSVHARVTRQGEDGMGLSFVLPPGLNTNLWGVLVRNIVTLPDSDQIAEMFRTLRTVLFLCRLCQPGVEEPIQLLDGRLDAEHVETLCKIALAAEKMLAVEPDFERRRALPGLVANILRLGSWTHDEVIIQYWAGLLVSSCLVDEADNANQVFIDLLVHVTPEMAKIFTYACKQAEGTGEGGENSVSSSVVITVEKSVALTNVPDIYRNATSVAYLFNLGLVQQTPDFTSYLPLEKIDITPTRMGLELYKHCHGARSKADSELILAAEMHLRDFLPEPITES